VPVQEFLKNPGIINDWLVAWPTAFRLETLLKINWDWLYDE